MVDITYYRDKNNWTRNPRPQLQHSHEELNPPISTCASMPIPYPHEKTVPRTSGAEL